MALDRSNRYPGRFENPTTASPQGAFKNRTSPTAQDGSYFEADWTNDWDGFFARILNIAGVTPNGVIDTGSASQLYDALMVATPGRLLNIQRFSSSGSYTPTPGTNFIIVEAVGGGGGGGGSTNVMSAGGGGGAGCYVMASTQSVPSSVTVTIGNGGTGRVNTDGNSGGTTSFGSLISVGGGTSGKITLRPSTSDAVVSGTPGPGSKVYTVGASMTLINVATGGAGSWGFCFNESGDALGGAGGASFFGGGGNPAGITASQGDPAVSRGAGGSGAAGNAATGTKMGGSGAAGLVIVREYS